jgi:hypothetical protein
LIECIKRRESLRELSEYGRIADDELASVEPDPETRTRLEFFLHMLKGGYTATKMECPRVHVRPIDVREPIFGASSHRCEESEKCRNSSHTPLDDGGGAKLAEEQVGLRLDRVARRARKKARDARAAGRRSLTVCG